MFFFTSSGWEATSKPATHALPPVGRLSPVSMRMAVVLPAPLAPRKPKISPRWTWKEMWSTAVKLPNRLVNPSTSITLFSWFSTRSCCKPGGQRMPAKRVRIRSGVSMPFISPSLMKAMRSHWRASSMMGVEAMMVIPRSFSRRSIPQNSLRDTGSTPVVGSSRKRTSGLWIRAQLRASFCFMPPDNAPARRLRKGSICR